MKASISIAIFIMFISLTAYSQQTNTDTIYVAGCGTSPDEITLKMKGYEDYLKKKDNPNYSPDSPVVLFTAQDSFPDSAIIRCGNFRIYYEDFLHSPSAGFADMQNGLARRNTLCQVLQYVQSIISIESQDTLDLYIDRSFTSSNPPPANYLYALVLSCVN